MMKRGWGGMEDDNKIMPPLFPRLHVNDAADKGGGPRAPPRNKMALYEQLTIPSQKFNPYSAGAFPSGTMTACSAGAASSSQGGSRERGVFSPYTHQAPSQFSELVQSHLSNPKNLNSTGIELMKRSLGHANHKSSSALGSTTECNSFRLHDFSSIKSSCDEKFDDEDDFMVPTFAPSDTAHSSKRKFVTERTISTPLHTNSPEKRCSATPNTSIRFPSSYDKPLEQVSADPKSGIYGRNYTGHKSKETLVIKEHKEKSVFHLKTGNELAANCSKASSDQEQTSRRGVIEKQHEKNTRVCVVSSSAMSEPECLNAIHSTENEDAAWVRNESCIKASFGSNHRSPDMDDDCNRGTDDKVSGSVELKDADKNDEVSETSVVDSISCLEISPDDVVGVIGPKQFWKARRAIVNQQKVFAVQVFELHRLIEVQKLIAAYPYLLHEENPFLSGSPQTVPDENLPPESGRKSQPQIAKQEDVSQKLKQNTKSQTENASVPPLLSHDGLNKGLCQLPIYPPYSGTPPLSVPVTPENKLSAWCYPHTNHWLVPVMSPSEGLIYKPYPGPYPPAAGFMPPVYGNCGPFNMPPANGDFANTAYSVPTSHQQQNMPVFSGTPSISPNYFPSPRGFPVVNTNISASAVEQVNPIMGPRPSMQTEQWSRSSCNMGIPRSEAFSGSRWKAPTSKDSELQGSTSSSPFERGHTGGRGALPLFPTVPAAEGSDHPSQSRDGDQQTRVIKVVPHNARSATESAARIFLSIQKERQQYES